jgi:4-hydroxythreonine-4-phosphate dehydrogenase
MWNTGLKILSGSLELKYMPILALTAGEPAGIGPDLCVQIAQEALSCRLVVIADRDMLQQRAALLRLPLEIIERPAAYFSEHEPGSLQIAHTPVNVPVSPGKLDSANASYVLRTLQYAVQGCQNGMFDAMVTAPVHKGIITEAGIPFTGHTEYLAEMTHSQVVMMLVGGNMRVTLATTHLPLKEVAAAITADRLEQKLRIIHHELVDRFFIQNPCIVVAGLNPHAGEFGHMGREEIDVIIPVLNKLRAEGMNLLGPLPADTLFNPARLKEYDCILAMYHDQGLSVLKYASFGTGVNVTLGLPIIRTSVDHGTAIDLVGTGQANPGSLRAAIELAIALAQKQHASQQS